MSAPELSDCLACGSWCCRGERPFCSREEAARLGVKAIDCREGGDCVFLQDGKCSRYEDRPLECRIFPLDVLAVDGVLTWVLWGLCPAWRRVEALAAAERLERELVAELPADYLQRYVAHHRAHQPAKYSAGEFVVLRPVQMPS